MEKDKSGIIIVNKPKDFTSFDVVAKLRGILKMKKIGHTGTLDPMATGVLPIFIGNGTRAINFLNNHDKEYIATVQLGIKTDTDDITGNVLQKYDDVNISYENLEKTINSFLGKQKQLPPMYSAIKINGKKLYEYAREGKIIDREERDIEIYEIKLLSYNNIVKSFDIRVRCSKGTYIRTLASDIAKKLDTIGTLSSLNRSVSNGYKIDASLTFSDIEKFISENDYSFISPVETAFFSFPKINLGEKKSFLFCNGVKLEINSGEIPVHIIHTVFNSSNKFLGLAHVEKNILVIDRIFK